MEPRRKQAPRQCCDYSAVVTGDQGAWHGSTFSVPQSNRQRLHRQRRCEFQHQCFDRRRLLYTQGMAYPRVANTISNPSRATDVCGCAQAYGCMLSSALNYNSSANAYNHSNNATQCRGAYCSSNGTITGTLYGPVSASHSCKTGTSKVSLGEYAHA